MLLSPAAPLTQSLSSRVVLQETTVCLQLCCARGSHPGSLRCACHCSQVARHRVVQELCWVLAYALQKSKRAAIRKGKSSLAAEQFLLTLTYPPWRKTAPKPPLSPFQWVWLFCFDFEPSLSLYLPQQAQLCHSDGQRRKDFCVWERLLERAVGRSCSGLSLGTMDQTAPHVVKITASLQPLRFSPQQPPKFHWWKKKWGGWRRSQKNYCAPREGKRWTALFSLSSFADVNHFSHFKQERHHFSPPVPLFIMLCISHELSLMQNLYIVRGHPNIFNDLKQSDWH